MKDIKKIVMLSGGVDSTLVAYNCLQNNENIHLHHVHITNSENRQELESHAIDNILDYFKQNFNSELFQISYSAWEESALGGIGRDYLVYLLAAQRMAIHLSTKHAQVQIHVGYIQEDFIETIAIREEWAELLWRTFLETDVTSYRRTNISKTLYQPIAHLHKSDVLHNLPKELIEFCWSCRHPLHNKPCGICRPCQELAEAKEKLK